MKTGIELIAEERREQVEKHGFNLNGTDEFYNQDELMKAAIYALTFDRDVYPESWNFWFHDKLKAKEARMSEMEFAIERRRIAGALIAADIDRLQMD